MNARVMRAGIAGGIARGMVMAAFSMIALWVAGSGFWTPLNLIAYTLWRADSDLPQRQRMTLPPGVCIERITGDPTTAGCPSRPCHV
jgi:hypothetical protein